MFILQMPITNDPSQVMPRPIQPGGTIPGALPTAPQGPLADPFTPALNDLRQQQAVIRRGFTRIGPQNQRTSVGQTMTSLLGSDCTYNDDGSFSRPNDTGKYHYQADGSVFYAGGQITLPNGQVVQRNPQTLRNPLNPTSTWDSSPDGRLALRHTFVLNRLDLVPDGSGGFIRPGEGNTGRYLLQPDGSIFFEGGQIGGQNARAQTYVNGQWNTTRNTPISGTTNIQTGRFTLNHDGTCRCPGCGDSLYVLPNGGLLNINANGTGGSTYNNGSWTTLTAQDLARAEVQTGIQAIIRSRTERGWRYPGP